MKSYKELLIISGKGGSGKTSITAALAAYAKNNLRTVLADCDVDAADLNLVIPGRLDKRADFYSGFVAITGDDCVGCGKCGELCPFDAIKIIEGKPAISENGCEGCGICEDHCPAGSIKLVEALCGQIFLTKTDKGMLSHARLGVGGENSGKLVSAVRKQAQEIAVKSQAELIISDGPPGIGCPVIASITDTDVALVVTEPTLSGLHDLERVIRLTKHFGVKILVCINKCDINPDVKDRISDFCRNNGGELIGNIRYSEDFTRAQNDRCSVLELADCEIFGEIIFVCENVLMKTMN